MKSAMTEFSINYDESVAYFGKEQKWVGVIGSLHIDDEENVTLEIPREIPWQYRDFCHGLHLGDLEARVMTLVM